MNGDSLFEQYVELLNHVCDQLEGQKSADVRKGVELAINIAMVYKCIEKILEGKDGD